MPHRRRNPTFKLLEDSELPHYLSHTSPACYTAASSIYMHTNTHTHTHIYICVYICESVTCSAVSDSVTPWTVVPQAPLSVEFSKQAYQSGNHFLLKGIFPNQELNLGLLNCRHILYHLSHQEIPYVNIYIKNIIVLLFTCGNFYQIKLYQMTSLYLKV